MSVTDIVVTCLYQTCYVSDVNTIWDECTREGGPKGHLQ